MSVSVDVFDLGNKVLTSDSTSLVTLGLVGPGGGLVDGTGIPYSEYLSCDTGLTVKVAEGIATWRNCAAVSYTHLTLPTKRIV